MMRTLDSIGASVTVRTKNSNLATFKNSCKLASSMQHQQKLLFLGVNDAIFCCALYQVQGIIIVVVVIVVFVIIVIVIYLLVLLLLLLLLLLIS